MKMKFVVAALLAASTLAMGQKIKSKNEENAVRALLGAQTPDAKIAAAEEIVTKFKDSEWKSIALFQAGQAAQQKGDAAGAINYGTRAIEADAKNYQALLLVSGVLAQGVGHLVAHDHRDLVVAELQALQDAPVEGDLAAGHAEGVELRRADQVDLPLPLSRPGVPVITVGNDAVGDFAQSDHLRVMGWPQGVFAGRLLQHLLVLLLSRAL